MANKPTAPPATTTAARASPPQLMLERTFHATPERLWKFWTDPKLYAKWIYPGKTDVAMHKFEAKVGGECSFDMLLDTGENMPNAGVFHVLDKPRRIEAGSPDKSFLIVATFDPVGADKTRLTVTVTGVPAEFHEMATVGWNSCFDKLTRQLDAPGVSGPARGNVKDRTVYLTRWFNASPAKLYDAWTNREMLPKFFWPVGTGVVKSLDVKVGGKLVMGHSQFPDWVATWEFLALTPGKSIAIRDHWPDGKTTMDGTMEFIAENGGTRLNATFGPFPKTGPYQPEGAASGSAMVADRLAELLEVAQAGEGFRIVRYFNVPTSKVYQMWTTKEGLAKWWGPSAKAMGYDFKVNKLDVKVGGEYDIVMSNKEHGELHNHGKYTEIVANKRIAQQWHFDIFLAPGEKPYPIAITIELEECPTMEPSVVGTKMTFTQGPMAKADFTEGSRQGVIQNLEHLGKALETKA